MRVRAYPSGVVSKGVARGIGAAVPAGATEGARRPPCPGRLRGIERQRTPAEPTGPDFFRTVLPEDQARFDKLAQALQQQLTWIKVYKVGEEAENEIYLVGKTKGGQWAGLKTTVGET